MLPNFSAYITSKTALIRFSECLAAEVREFGVSVFAMGPGTVRTAMSEHSLNSPEGKKWLPWFARIFDEHLDLPPERPAEIMEMRCDNTKAKTLLGWEPRHTLAEGLAKTIDWYRTELAGPRSPFNL